MWKIIVGFIVFAAIAMFVVIKGGDKIDMAGEQHGVTPHDSAASAPASAPAPAASAPAAPASAASN